MATKRDNSSVGELDERRAKNIKRSNRRLIELPEEILLKIFTFLDPIFHLSKLRSVCSVWDRTIRDPAAWLRVEFLNKASDINDKVITDLLEYCSATKVLNLGGCTSLTRCKMELIPTKCSSLTELSISQIKIPCKSITAIIENLPQLIKINLSFTKANNAVLATLSKSCPKLEHINIRGCEVMVLPKFGPDLVYFDASGSNISISSLLALESTKLEVLLLWKINGSSAVRLTKRDVMFPALRKFVLSSARATQGEEELGKLLSQSHSLEEIEVVLPKQTSKWILDLQLDNLRSFIGHVEDDELNYIIDNSNVTTLCIPWSPITNESISNLHKLSSVQHLDISGSVIQEKELRKIAASCSNLVDTKFQVGSCHNLPRHLRHDPLQQLRNPN